MRNTAHHQSSCPSCNHKQINPSRRKVIKAVGMGMGALTVPGLLREASTMVFRRPRRRRI